MSNQSNLKPAWKKGKSGNPLGATPGMRQPHRITKLAREQSEKAIKSLARICNSEKSPASAVVAAAVALLDRGWGRPLQQVEAKIGYLDDLSESDERALLAALQSLRGETDGDDASADETHH